VFVRRAPIMWQTEGTMTHCSIIIDGRVGTA